MQSYLATILVDVRAEAWISTNKRRSMHHRLSRACFWHHARTHARTHTHTYLLSVTQLSSIVGDGFCVCDHRCKMNPDAVPAMEEKGGLSKIFGHATTDPELIKKHTPTIISRDPWIVTFDNFVTDEEAAALLSTNDGITAHTLTHSCPRTHISLTHTHTPSLFFSLSLFLSLS